MATAAEKRAAEEATAAEAAAVEAAAVALAEQEAAELGALAAAEEAEAREAAEFEAQLVAEEEAAHAAAAAAEASEGADVAARAAAIAALAGGNPVGEGALGGAEDVPVTSLPAGTGQVHEWGGDVPYLVVSTLFNAMVDDWHQTAYQGDTVKPTEQTAARGVDLLCLVALDED